MDEDVIDVTNMSEAERQEHFRHLDQLTTCPCNSCTGCRIGQHPSDPGECPDYQSWMDFQYIKYPLSVRGRLWKYRK